MLGAVSALLDSHAVGLHMATGAENEHVSVGCAAFSHALPRHAVTCDWVVQLPATAQQAAMLFLCKDQMGDAAAPGRKRAAC